MSTDSLRRAAQELREEAEQARVSGLNVELRPAEVIALADWLDWAAFVRGGRRGEPPDLTLAALDYPGNLAREILREMLP